jgi:hypothetical protein
MSGKLSNEFYTVTENTIFIAYAKKGLVKITYDPLKARDKSYLVTGLNFQDAKNSVAISLRESDFVKMKMYAEGYLNDPTGKSFEGQYGAQIAFSKYNNEIKSFSFKAGNDNNPQNKTDMTVLLSMKQGNTFVNIPIDYYTLVSIIYLAENALNNRYETTNSILRSMARMTDSIPNNIGFNIFNAIEQKMQASKNYNGGNNNNQNQLGGNNQQMNNAPQFGNNQPVNNQPSGFGNNQASSNGFGNQGGNQFSGQPSGQNSNSFSSGQSFNKGNTQAFGGGNNNNLNPNING